MEQIRDWFRRHLSDPQVVILSLILLVGVLVVTATNRILAPVFASLVLAYLLEGAVRPLEARGLPRPGAASLVFTGFMVVLVALLLVLGPALWRQTVQLMADLPQILAQGQQVLMGLPEQYPDLITEAQVDEVMNRIHGDITGLGQAILQRSVASVVGLLTVMVYLVLMPLMVFFFLKDKDRIIEWAKGFLPEDRGLVRQVWLDVDLQIGNYVRGKVWEIVIVWGVTAAIFSLLDLRGGDDSGCGGRMVPVRCDAGHHLGDSRLPGHPVPRWQCLGAAVVLGGCRSASDRDHRRGAVLRWHLGRLGRVLRNPASDADQGGALRLAERESDVGAAAAHRDARRFAGRSSR
jgi:AI-2E family transporter